MYQEFEGGGEVVGDFQEDRNAFIKMCVKQKCDMCDLQEAGGHKYNDDKCFREYRRINSPKKFRDCAINWSEINTFEDLKELLEYIVPNFDQLYDDEDLPEELEKFVDWQ